jgi:hypothetical protein
MSAGSIELAATLLSKSFSEVRREMGGGIVSLRSAPVLKTALVFGSFSRYMPINLLTGV